MARGYSLVELVIGLGVASLITVWSYPGLSDMLLRAQAKTGINRLVSAVNFTRMTAITRYRTTTLCALKNTGKCGAAWQGELTVFLDGNQNGFWENGEEVIARIAGLNDGSSVRWRSFGNRQYLQFTPMGYTSYQNGNFVVCPERDNARLARQLIINVQGRARLNHVRDKNGFLIDRSGKRLRC